MIKFVLMQNKNKEGADSDEAFNVSTNIAGVKLRARATGTLSSANLNNAASVKKTTTKKGSTTDNAEAKPSEGGSSTPDSGSTTTGGGSSTGSGGQFE